jgi:hypothetical protein
MKKGFGIFFIVVGGLNILSVIITAFGAPENMSKYPERVGKSFVIGIGILGLGMWMLNSSKKANNITPTKQ